MIGLRCIFVGHAWTSWTIYPRIVGARVEWLRWESRCLKCRQKRQRWFRVELRDDRRVPNGIREAVSVEKYLLRMGAVPPHPDTLRDGPMPAEILESLAG